MKEGQRVSLVKPASCIIWNLRNPWTFCHEPVRGRTSSYSPLSRKKPQNEGENAGRSKGQSKRFFSSFPNTEAALTGWQV